MGKGERIRQSLAEVELSNKVLLGSSNGVANVIVNSARLGVVEVLNYSLRSTYLFILRSNTRYFFDGQFLILAGLKCLRGSHEIMREMLTK